ncbi:alpha/beta hydrolase [Sphingorhabdus sp. YGSMI21]|uniref:alpha/beta fold hydrolase n=1 Tax=Sphingorhabdus sp. YGSMI21 TaxID=2077182 RepID=UPI000C1DE4C4|nr:alpha/beta hydrolase [Sphingorhabdus sp. YGSMI21]ATW03450.1 alpha/beta hydrolase [Sphingorhabdus sp. YGSMI21]
MANTDIVDQWAASHDLPAWFVRAMDVPREEAFVEVDGHKVHYFRWGTRGKPPLLMTHGFLAHARCFAFIAPFLAEDYDIVAYDLAGMGESEMIPDCDGIKRAKRMVAIADALDLFAGPVKPKIIAHSFGSGVALQAMELAGDRFGGLVICDLMVLRPERLIAHFKGGGGPPGSGRSDRPNKLYPDYEAAYGRFVLSPPQAVQQPFLFDYMAYHSLRRVEDGETQGWSWKFDPMVFHRHEEDQEKWLQTGQRIVDLPHRVAIVYGENSRLFDGDSADYLRELGGNHVPMIAVPEAEHHLMLDQPLALVTALRSILALWAD